jgi:hypothetical protein
MNTTNARLGSALPSSSIHSNSILLMRSRISLRDFASTAIRSQSSLTNRATPGCHRLPAHAPGARPHRRSARTLL